MRRYPLLKNRHFKLDAGQPAKPIRFLSSAVEVDATTKVSVVTLTRTGKFFDPRYGKFEITPKMLLAMVTNFDSGVFGQDIFIDRAHNANGGAAGTIQRLFLDGGKLRAEVAWTTYGMELIEQKGYRYLSAEFIENFISNEEPHTEHGTTLLGAGLCVRPCIKNLDRIELAEPDAAYEGYQLISRQLATQLYESPQMEKYIKLLKEALAAKKLSEEMITFYANHAIKLCEGATDDAEIKQRVALLQETALSLAESNPGANPENVVINLTAPGATGLDEAAVKKLFADMQTQQAGAVVASQQKLTANVKLFTDAIDEAKDLDEETKTKVLAAQDLITGDMGEAQIIALAATQLSMGNEIAAAKKLVAMGFNGGQGAQGSVFIASGANVGAITLAEDVRKQLRLTSAFSNQQIVLAEKAPPFVDNVLALFDNQYGVQLAREHKILSGDEGNMVDVDLPYAFRREVIRESLSDMQILALVATRTDPSAQATTQVPYEQRKNHTAVNNGIVFERGAIPTAGVTQKMDLAYINAMKIAFNVSDELMHFSRVSNVNWDAWGRHVATCSRILRELVVQRLANEMLRTSDSHAATAVTGESIASQLDGSTSTIKTVGFPIVRPHQSFDLAGTPIGAASNPITIVITGATIEPFDGSGTQASGIYYVLSNVNLGYVTFVDEAGAAVTPSSATATIAYSVATNVSKFDLDLPTDVSLEKHLNGLLRSVGARKALMKDDRFEAPNFLLMSNTLNDTVTNAEEFVVSLKRNGADTTSMGDLEAVKALPAFSTNAPGIDLGDERILMGQRGTTSYTVAKAFALSEMQEGRDPVTSQLNGTKEAYGQEFNSIYTPKPIADRYTSILVYSAGNR